jgi:DinB superfamily
MNPYASHLGNRDPLEVIEATPRKLTDFVQTLGSGVNQSPAPGKWSAREIISHLADCEVVFAFRLRQAIAETHHVIQPFDQEAWARSYAAYTATEALETFAVVRRWNLNFIRHLPREGFAKKLTHPERGEMNFQVVVETMGGHDLNHLAQVEKIASSQRSAAKGA